MIEGDPYRTAELDGLRSEQRRVLLAMKDGSVEAGLREVRGWLEESRAHPECAPAAMEWALRRFLKSALEGHQGLIDSLQRRLECELLQKAAQPVAYLVSQHGMQIQLPGLTEPLIEHSQVPTLAGLAGLLICAELLSDDGWSSDTRLPAFNVSIAG